MNLKKHFKVAANKVLGQVISLRVKQEGTDWKGTIEGLDCLLRRQPKGLHWEGLVKVPQYHKWNNKTLHICAKTPQCMPKVFEFLKPPNNQVWDCDHRLAKIIDAKRVHGGITFAGKLDGEEGWWLGFDCGHSGDLSPGILKIPKIAQLHLPPYRDKKFAFAQLTKLAKIVKSQSAQA